MLYIVGGLRRTGTSMMMHCLQLGGMELYYDEDIEKALKKRLGDPYYYETNTRTVPYNEIDGKCIKLMGDKPARIKGPSQVVYMLRKPQSQAKSLMQTHGEVERYMEQALYNIHTIQMSAFVKSCTVVDYDATIKNPWRVFRTLRDMGWPINDIKSASGVDESLRHY